VTHLFEEDDFGTDIVRECVIVCINLRRADSQWVSLNCCRHTNLEAIFNAETWSGRAMGMWYTSACVVSRGRPTGKCANIEFGPKSKEEVSNVMRII